MREFKFRAWNKKTKEMLPDRDNEGNLYAITAVDWGNIYEIMQYTGLKDINDKEIYEGDILKNLEIYPRPYDGKDKNLVGIAFFDQELGGYYITKKTKNCYDHEKTLQRCTAKNYEIVGNIYEDKDWLKIM